LFEDIAARLNLSLNGVYAVGDAERDLVAARAVSARPVLVRTGKGARTLKKSKNLNGVPVYADLAAFTDALLAGDLPA
jgi:D-glycero-D-manno-heptose 1,7-bisphosphate phosphatase